MKKTLLLTLIVGLFLNKTYSQELKKQKVIDDRSRTSHTFYVLKNDPNIKQGSYTFKYKNFVQIQGQFDNNLQVGEWIYTPDKEFKIVGNFAKGKKEGEWKYYLNNNLISVMLYSNGILNGKSKGYFENGQIACELNYIDNVKNGLKTIYFKNGTVKETVDYTNGYLHGSCQLYDSTGELCVRGQFMGGFIVGMWDYDINNPEKRTTKAYNLADSIRVDSVVMDQNTIEIILQKPEILPKFDGGSSQQFHKHIAQSVVYPKQADAKGKGGIVITQFKIGTTGLLHDFKILNESNNLFKKEAERIIRTSPLWRPGFSDYFPIEVLYSFPINFVPVN